MKEKELNWRAFVYFALLVYCLGCWAAVIFLLYLIFGR